MPPPLGFFLLQREMASKNITLLLLQLLLSLPTLVIPAKVPAIIVFGDSTVDTGNNNHISTVLKSNFKPYGRDFIGNQPTGRFCNGRLASDFMSEAFGLGPTVPAYLDPIYGIKDFATGVCFASAGTGFDNATSDVLSVIPLWKEVEYFKDYQNQLTDYLGKEKAKQILNEAVYIVSIGTNDFLENYFAGVTGRSKQFRVEEFEDFLIGIAADFLTNIYYLGARKISFTGLSPIGCLPLVRSINFMKGDACVEDYNNVAKEFNVKLQSMIMDLCGFENVDAGCCATGMFEMGYMCNQLNPLTCIDAEKYMFWDAFHPTEKMNRILANHALNTSLAEFL